MGDHLSCRTKCCSVLSWWSPVTGSTLLCTVKTIMGDHLEGPSIFSGSFRVVYRQVPLYNEKYHETCYERPPVLKDQVFFCAFGVVSQNRKPPVLKDQVFFRAFRGGLNTVKPVLKDCFFVLLD